MIVKTEKTHLPEKVKCGNPYMPLWEHVPDGEPRVFEHNGERRVYVYGSHDTERDEYCGRDYVVWSAPENDLSDWTCHGVCYRATDGGILFAPDVVYKDGTYYLYAAEARGSRVMVAKSGAPWGPFTDPVRTELGFDPSVLVDDDGRVYAFWGFCEAHCGELSDDMATLLPGTYRAHPIGHCRGGRSPDRSHIDEADGFYEAASQRKILGKYVLIYSKRYDDPVPDVGARPPCSAFLSYKYSDSPLGDFQPGGDISFNGGEILSRRDGKRECTYRWGNNHGSICEINGRWYIFYHRQTGTNEFSRQAMAEPVEVAVGEDGHLFIGKIERGADREPVSSGPVEMTSSGLVAGGLPARRRIAAAYTCGISGESCGVGDGGGGGAYVLPVYERDAEYPIVGITAGTRVAFRYVDFGEIAPERVNVRVRCADAVRIAVRIDDRDGDIIAETEALPEREVSRTEVSYRVTGKRAVYFEFFGQAEFVEFWFE